MAKSKYDTYVAPYLDRIAKWVEQGATQAEVAKKLHIGKTTIKKYLALGEQGKEPYAAFAACFARACEVPDDNVEAALYRSAIGYTAKVAKNFKIKKIVYDEGTGRKIEEEEKLVTGYDEVHVPANVVAQQFWLANRRPDKWKYKPEAGTDPDGQSGTGVVELPAVMDNPGPPDKDVTPDG